MTCGESSCPCGELILPWLQLAGFLSLLVRRLDVSSAGSSLGRVSSDKADLFRQSLNCT